MDDVLCVVVLNDDVSVCVRGWSVIKLWVKLISGLLRSVAWVLYGLDFVVYECVIVMDVNGVVEMVFECIECVGLSGM